MNPYEIPGLSPEKLKLLLAIAGKKLGQSPDQLKKQLQSGNMEGLMANMNPQSQKQMTQLLQNPNSMEALMKDEKIKAMLASLTGKK